MELWVERLLVNVDGCLLLDMIYRCILDKVGTFLVFVAIIWRAWRCKPRDWPIYVDGGEYFSEVWKSREGPFVGLDSNACVEPYTDPSVSGTSAI